MPSFPIIDKNSKMIQSPHIVILGAGASKASFPNGDKNHNELPLMNELINILKLEELLKKYNIRKKIDDFELLYSEIAQKKEFSELKRSLQENIVEYFRRLELPDEVTIYDYLLLSLRKKDIIATFNWDPLLLQAFYRNRDLKELPEIAFLHGNVLMGKCSDDQILGLLGTNCQKCGKKLDPVQILYPTTEKNYNKDPVIKNAWDKIKNYLEYGYFLTIFGYSAPKTDVEAIEMLNTPWTSNNSFEISQVEIIDIKDEKEIYKNWSDFIERDHYVKLDVFNQSWLWNHPKCSCEALFDATMQNSPREPKPFPKTKSLNELHNFIMDLKIERLKI